MPTPAVNFASYMRYPGSAVYRYKNGTVDVVPVQCNVAYWAKVRPASRTTIPVDKYGLRPMTGWSHLWVQSEMELRPTTLTWIGAPLAPTAIASIDVDPGGFWRDAAAVTTQLPAPSWLKPYAEMKALAKLQDQDTDFGVFLAEAKEAAHTIVSTMLRIAKEVRSFRRKRPKDWNLVRRYDWHVKRGNVERTRGRIRELPSQWLALTYGWTPLIQDCFGAINALEKARLARQWDYRVIGKSKTVESLSISFPCNLPIVGGATLKVDTKYVAKGLVDLYYKLRSPGVALLSKLGLINPALIAWERVPYSFVVDWFVPVSGWLNSLTAASGYDFIAGCYSETVRAVDHTASVVWPYPNWRLSNTEAWKWRKAGHFTRQLYVASPVPGLYFKSPFSVKHVANALALLHNAFK